MKSIVKLNNKNKGCNNCNKNETQITGKYNIKNLFFNRGKNHFILLSFNRAEIDGLKKNVPANSKTPNQNVI